MVHPERFERPTPRFVVRPYQLHSNCKKRRDSLLKIVFINFFFFSKLTAVRLICGQIVGKISCKLNGENAKIERKPDHEFAYQTFSPDSGVHQFN